MENFEGKLYDFIPGFLIGGIFSLSATILQMVILNLNFSAATILNLHRTEPLLWIIDTSPVILSLVGAGIIGQARYLKKHTNLLNQNVEEQAERIKNTHSFFEALVTNSPYAVVQLDANHRVVSLNPAFEALFGWSGSEIIGQTLDEFVASPAFFEEASDISRHVTSGRFVKRVSKRMKKDGSLLDVEIFGVPVFVGGEKIGALGLYNDISTQKRMEQELLTNEARFRSLFKDSPISLWEEDFSAVKERLDTVSQVGDVIARLENDDAFVKELTQLVKVLDVNQATLDLYKASSKSDLLGNLSHVLTEESWPSVRNELIALARGETKYDCEIAQRKMDGEILHGLLRLSLAPACENSWDKVFISIVDITERKEAEKKLRYMSFHDALTGLYNRAYFEEEMARLEKSRQYPLTIFSCDMDNLKQINDNFGHESGDRAIKSMAKILTTVFRNEDVVARTGGDEFVVILPYVDYATQSSIRTRLDCEIEQFNRSSEDDGLYRPVSISYGSATIELGEPLIEGYKRADRQMYAHKQAKKELVKVQ